jgi:hypothetical protein
MLLAASFTPQPLLLCLAFNVERRPRSLNVSLRSPLRDNESEANNNEEEITEEEKRKVVGCYWPLKNL